MENSLGSRLQYALGIRRISQSEIAVKADVSITYISLICQNKKNPSGKLVARLCSILRISREWLLHGTGNMEETADPASDVSLITSQLVNSDPRSLKRIFALVIANLSESQLQTVEDVIDEFIKQRRKAAD